MFIAIAHIVSFMFGSLWFMVIFKETCLNSLRITTESKKPKEFKFKEEGLLILGNFICGLIITITTAFFIKELNIETISDGIILSIIIGAGYLIPVTLNAVLNPNIPHPFIYTAIVGGYLTTSTVLVSTILIFNK